MSQNTPSANDVLMGGGGAVTAKFQHPGDTVGGRIVAEPRVYQEREYDPRNPGNGAPKFYPKSGDPIMSVSVDVQTTLRDPSVEDDDGVRRIYIEGKRLKDAVRDAVRQAGAPGLQVGGHLDVTFTGLGQAENGMNAPKLYEARYTPASAGAVNAALGNTAPAQQAPAQQYAQAAYQQAPAPQQQAAPAAAPAAQENPAEKVKQLANLGLDDATIAAATGLDQTVVSAIRAA